MRFQADQLTWDGAVKSESINGNCSTCSGSGSVGLRKDYYYIEIADWYYGVGEDQPNQVVRIVVEDTVDPNDTPVYRKLFGVNHNGTAIREAFLVDPTDPNTDIWCRSTIMNDDWRVTERRMPSAHNGKVTSNADLKKFLDPYDPITDSWSNDSDTVDPNVGLVYHYEFDNTAGKRPTATLVSEGADGTKYYVSATDYGDGDDDGHGLDADEGKLPVARYTYPSKTSSRTDSSRLTTTLNYTFWDHDPNDPNNPDSDVAIKTIETVHPNVSTAQNGSGVETKTYQYFDKSGRLRWTKDGEGYVAYYSYHPDTGQLSYTMVDVDDPASPGDDVTSGSSGWIAWTVDGANNNKPTRGTGLPDGLELVTKREFDDQGRFTKEIDPGGSIHHTLYHANQSIRFPYWNSTANKPELPIQVTETDGGGTLQETFTIDPAQSTGTGTPNGFTDTQSKYVSWTRFFYNKVNGKQVKTLRYHDIPSSGDGTHLDDYYVTAYDYDNLGHRSVTVQTVQSTINYKDQIHSSNL